MKWLGNKLRSIIERKNLSVVSFSKSIGVTRETVYNWFSGQVPHGLELMKICKELSLNPSVFFEEDLVYSVPKHRMKANAKHTANRDKEADAFICEQAGLFTEDSSSELGLKALAYKDVEASRLACEFRKKSGVLEDQPMGLSNVLHLATYLNIFIVFISFPETIKTDALYSCISKKNRVIFIRSSMNLLDAVYIILHEICHAVINGGFSKETMCQEEIICEKVANLSQFPLCYLNKMQDLFSCCHKSNVGASVVSLKDLSKKNLHTPYGVMKAVDLNFKTKYAQKVAAASTNLKKEICSIKQYLQNHGLESYLSKLQEISPLYFNRIILEKMDSLSDRKLCEILDIEDIAIANELRDLLKRLCYAEKKNNSN